VSEKPQHDGGVRFEKTDVEGMSVLRAGFVLLLAAGVVSLALIYVFRVMVAQEFQADPPAAPLVRAEADRHPPEPRLQTLPFDDYEKLRAEEDDVLDHYGWVDEKGGVVHIPIKDAMEQVAGKLPSRGQK
jgi:hypothetical protein